MAKKQDILDLIQEVNTVSDKAKDSLVDTLTERNIEPSEISIIGIPDDVDAVALVISDSGLLMLRHKKLCPWL